MAHPEQAWEDFAETGKFLTDHLYALTDKGIVEYDILVWLARYRREMAKENFDCDEGEADLITAKILEATVNELDRIGLKVVQSGIALPTTGVVEISEDTQRELNERLLAVLDEGVDEIGILRWLALWRKQASMDDKRDQLRPFDLQLARVVHSAADNLANALEEWAESDPFETANEEDDDPSNEQSETPQRIIMTPGARILSKNPGLMEGCTDFAGMMKRLNRTGRNEPCPCKSGKKFKKCCGGI